MSDDDSFDETRTYLTAMQEEHALKRTATAVPGRRHHEPRVVTAKPALTTARNAKTSRPVHLNATRKR